MADFDPANRWLIDLTGLDLVSAAPFDVEKAKEALLLTAQCLDDCGQLSRTLATYLARAIREAYGPGARARGANARFLTALGVMGGHRRKEGADWLEVGRTMEKALDENGHQRNKAARLVAKRFGVSPPTVIRRYNTYMNALKAKEQEDWANERGE